MNTFSRTASTPHALATLTPAQADNGGPEYARYAAIYDGAPTFCEEWNDTTRQWVLYDGERMSAYETARAREASAASAYTAHAHGETCDICGAPAVAILDYSGAALCGECAS